MRSERLLWSMFFVCLCTSPVLGGLTASGDVSPSDPYSWDFSTDAYIGQTSDGTLLVDSYESLWTSETRLGDQPGATGSVTMTEGSYWETGRVLEVGVHGSGVLNILDDSTFEDEEAYLGVYPGSSGIVNVDGQYTQWNHQFDLYVGYGGSGVMNISDEARVYNNWGQIGYSAGSDGLVTVHGFRSTWDTSRAVIGCQGSGRLEISDSGVVNSSRASIAEVSGSTGVVTIDGSGSVWSTAGDLEVGFYGQADLSISNGAYVEVMGDTWLGRHPGSSGHIAFNGGTLMTGGFVGFAAGAGFGSGTIHARSLVTDVDLVFDATHGLSQTVALNGSGYGVTIHFDLDGLGPMGAGYGQQQSGSMSISDGMVIQGSQGYVGYKPGSSGTVTVSGSGSAWNTADHLYLGKGGSGVLEILDGGSVQNPHGVIASEAWSQGRVTLSGAGTLWNSYTTIVVGHGGQGLLEISDGAAATTQYGDVAFTADSSGDVTVSGSDSSLTASLGWNIGLDGAGTLHVSDSGYVRSNTHLTLGANAEASGTVTVDGTGTLLSVENELHVGYYGSGSLNITAGGEVANQDGSIGHANAPSSPCAATVSGAGSAWTNSGTLSIGYSGSGSLNVSGAASVSNTYGYIADEAGSNGQATVVGANSTWTNSQDLYVGRYGSGSMDIADGATVSNVEGNIGAMAGSTGFVTISGTGSLWSNSQSLHVGRSGYGRLDISDGASVSNTIGHIGGHEPDAGPAPKIAASPSPEESLPDYTGVVTVSGAGASWNNSVELHVGYVDSFLGGFGDGTLEISDGGTVNSTVTYIAADPGAVGRVTLTDSGSSFLSSGGLYVGGDSGAAGGTGQLSVEGGSADIASELIIWPSGSVTITGGTLTTYSLNSTGQFNFHGGVLELTGGTLTISPPLTIPTGGGLLGSGDVQTHIIGLPGSSIAATGDLDVGDSTRYDGFTHAGTLSAGSSTVTLRTRGFAGLGVLTEISGGTLIAANGVIVGMGDNLVGSGSVNARVSAGFGSVIEAAGPLSLGDPGAYDGFVSDGVMIVGDNTVVLHDANQAVLGSLTELGSGGIGGTLTADGGLLVEFGKNIVGSGTIDTPDNAAAPLTNNGDIIGDGPAAIELTGYVMGVGTLTNVVVSGTFSPGFSPARVEASNLEIGSEGKLLMELGGLSGGQQYDQLAVSGTLTLGGTLGVSLIDGFTPDVGDTFDILDFECPDPAEFDAIELPELLGRKVWDISDLYTTGSIGVLAMLDGDTDVDWDVDDDDVANFIGVFGTQGDVYTDFNEDGHVDLMDFVILREFFGAVSSGNLVVGEIAATTPEPATFALLSLCGLNLLRRKRKNR